MRWSRLLLRLAIGLLVAGALVVALAAIAYSYSLGEIAQWRGERAAERIPVPPGALEDAAWGAGNWKAGMSGYRHVEYPPDRDPGALAAELAAALRVRGDQVEGPEQHPTEPDTWFVRSLQPPPDAPRCRVYPDEERGRTVLACTVALPR